LTARGRSHSLARMARIAFLLLVVALATAPFVASLVGCGGDNIVIGPSPTPTKTGTATRTPTPTRTPS